MATTSFQGGGYPGRLYGDFTGKEASAGGAHTPGRITTLQGGGYPGRLYGTFAGKSPSAGGGAGAHNPGRITTLQGGGYPGRLYGSFAGKAPSATTTTDSNITINDQWDGISSENRFDGITALYEF